MARGARKLNRLWFRHTAGKIAQLKWSGVRKDEIGFAVEVGPAMFTDVYEKDCWQKTETLPEQVIMR